MKQSKSHAFCFAPLKIARRAIFRDTLFDQPHATGKPMGIAVWIIIILVIAALVKYLLGDSGKK